MSLIELLRTDDDLLDRHPALPGVVTGIVTNNQDPDGLGRVKLKFPWLSDDQESDWARVAAPMAGGGRGTFFLPEVDDEVLVAFEHADVGRPVVLGGLWNGVDKPPHDNADGENNLRTIRSRSGHVITLDDTGGSEKIEIVDQAKKNQITIDSASNTITIAADQDIILSAPQGKITLESRELAFHAAASAKLESDQAVDVKAGAVLTLKGQTVNIN